DPEERHLTGSLEDRENRTVLQVVDGVVLPLPIAHHAPVDPQNGIQFAAMKGDRGGFPALAVIAQTDDGGAVLRAIIPRKIRLIGHRRSRVTDIGIPPVCLSRLKMQAGQPSAASHMFLFLPYFGPKTADS